MHDQFLAAAVAVHKPSNKLLPLPSSAGFICTIVKILHRRAL